MKKLINKVQIFFKKKKFTEEPEKVEIRLDSIPDWLYKITLDNPSELKDKANSYISRVKSLNENLQKSILEIKDLEIINNSVSQYKKEIFDKKKKFYFDKIKEMSDRITAMHDPSLDVKRADLERTYKEFREFNVKKDNYAKIIQEFFPKEAKKVEIDYRKILEELEGFQKAFRSENYEKVNKIIAKVHDLKSKLNEKEEIKKEILSINQNIDNIKQNIYKLSNKSQTLEKSQRYKDVLKERSELNNLVELKKNSIAELKRMFNKINLPKENTILDEYLSNFETALVNDNDLDVLKELNNLKEEDADLVKWLNVSLAEKRKEIINIEKKIISSWTSLKKYVIINELEDVEERSRYFKAKLIAEKGKKQNAIDKINTLGLEGIRTKIFKDILILTGYEINIIYDDKIK